MSSPELIPYTHDFLTEFIQLYRNYPCLWQVRCKGYKDRLLRNRAYDVLVQKLREINPLASRETVIRKINTLRTAFRREYKKVRCSQRTVTNPARRYTSSLWYYDMLKFVVDQNENPVSAKCAVYLEEEKGLKEESVPLDDYQEEVSIQTDVDKMERSSPIPSPEVNTMPSFQPVIMETEGSFARRFSADSIDVSRKKYQQDHDSKDAIAEVSPKRFAPCVTNDEFDTFGHYVASKLRKSMPRQGIIAEKVIADVLLRANLGTLDETTCLTEKPPSRCFLVMGDR